VAIQQGMNQQTAATQNIIRQAIGGRSANRSTRRRSRTKKKRAVRTARKAKSGKRARLVKGSRAAKAYMAKIRRKRK
jgi:hypothetical protein